MLVCILRVLVIIRRRTLPLWLQSGTQSGVAFNNVLRVTYSYQDEPRTYVGGMFPTVDILKDGAYYMGFGPDPFTEGNLRQVKTFVATDEASWTMGIQNFTAGVQFETNEGSERFRCSFCWLLCIRFSMRHFMAGGSSMLLMV